MGLVLQLFRKSAERCASAKYDSRANNRRLAIKITMAGDFEGFLLLSYQVSFFDLVFIKSEMSGDMRGFSDKMFLIMNIRTQGH